MNKKKSWGCNGVKRGYVAPQGDDMNMRHGRAKSDRGLKPFIPLAIVRGGDWKRGNKTEGIVKGRGLEYVPSTRENVYSVLREKNQGLAIGKGGVRIVVRGGR